MSQCTRQTVQALAPSRHAREARDKGIDGAELVDELLTGLDYATQGRPNKTTPAQVLQNLISQAWKLLKPKVASFQKIDLYYSKLPVRNKSTDRMFRDVIATVEEVTLNCALTAESLKCLWPLELGFTSLVLDMIDLSPTEQISVFRSINPGICRLILSLPEPDREVLETICGFAKLERVDICYAKANDHSISFPATDAIVEMT